MINHDRTILLSVTLSFINELLLYPSKIFGRAHIFTVSEQPPKPNDDCSRCELMHTLSGTALGLAFTGMVLGCVFYYFKGQFSPANCLVCFSTAQ